MGKRATEAAMCVAVAMAGGGGAWAAAPEAASQFNQPGNILITDQFNNRVIEVTRGGKVAWSFGSGGPASAWRAPEPSLHRTTRSGWPAA